MLIPKDRVQTVKMRKRRLVGLSVVLETRSGWVLLTDPFCNSS